MKSRPNWESPSLIFIYPTIRGKAKLSRPRMENPNRKGKNENPRMEMAQNAQPHGAKSVFLLGEIRLSLSLFIFV